MTTTRSRLLASAIATALLASACATVPGEATPSTDMASADHGQGHAAGHAPGHTEAGRRQAARSGGGHGLGHFFAAYDADGDGAVSHAEFIAEREAGFARRDADNNGVVHEDEYVAEYEARLDDQLRTQRQGQIEQAHVRFEVLDADDDEAMSLDEFHASGSRMFSRLDSNDDGVINDADTSNSY